MTDVVQFKRRRAIFQQEIKITQVLDDAITKMVRMDASFEEVARMLRGAADNLENLCGRPKQEA